ncbi:DJ-1/PfpI family protein [Treponema sp. OMZ 788]|uniref:DJ-1/PfpI family protein n=1 Tax=Treponema sp. OMZ 788 TaxID=2563664 RepID=UPI0020A3959D|nr:DJ-1/PfpI family protein [Treponema sp. OMZ 788]
MKKAFLFLANGFEDVEALTPIDYLRRAGIDLITVGVEGKTAVSSHNVPIICDIVLEEALQMESGLIAVILPGGLPNSSTLAGAEAVEDLAKKDPCKRRNCCCYLCGSCPSSGFLGPFRRKKLYLLPRNGTGFEDKTQGR